MKLSEFKINIDARENGDWVDVPGLPGVRFKVRGIGNRDWLAVVERETAALPFAEKRNPAGVGTEARRQIIDKAVLEAGLMDWSGIKGDDGKEIPYSRDLAEELIGDPAYDRFRDAVLTACGWVADIQSDDQETAGKNLQKA